MHRDRLTLAWLLGSASFLTLINGQAALAQQAAQPQMTAEEQVPKQVLVTGSLIRGTVAVGAPVTALGQQDFSESRCGLHQQSSVDVAAIRRSRGPQRRLRGIFLFH
jgi:hypothetical protein